MKKNIFVLHYAIFFAMLCMPMYSFSQNTFQIQSGAQLVCNGNIFTTLQDFSLFKNNGTLTSGNGTFVIQGNTIPTVIGSSGGSSIGFYDLVLNNTQGVQLAQPIMINDSLQMNSGNLNLKNNVVTFASSGGIKNETETARIMDDPTGAGQIIITQNLGASSNAIPGNLGVEINSSANAPGSTTITRYCGVVVYSGSSTGLIQRYYKIDPTNNSGLNASAKFHYLNAELNGADPSAAVLWKSSDNGISWSQIVPDARDVTAKWLQKNNINDFSMWTIGSSLSALPVIFSSFNTVCKNDGAFLQWSTGVETNSDYFVVEKSIDGNSWKDIVHLNASGITSDYQFEDHFAGHGFYRLKEVDKDGHFKYSKIIQSNCEVKNISVFLYPNPAEAFTSLTFNSSADFAGNVYIHDAGGRQVRKIPVAVQRGGNIIRINLLGMAKGVYLITLSEKDIQISKQLIVQ